MPSSSRTKFLHSLFTNKLLPWAASPRLRWMVATKYRRDLKLCDGVKMTPRTSKGAKIAKRGRRSYGNSRNILGEWPEDHLNSTKSPKLACVSTGHANLQFWDYELHVPESTFILILPGVPQPDGSLGHLGEDKPSYYCDVSWMIPRDNELQFWACRSERDKHFPLQWSNVLFLNPRLHLYLQLLHEEASKGADTSLIRHLLPLLMAGLQREAKSGNYLHFGQDRKPSWELEISTNPIEEAQEYIRAHYGSAITLESLARTVGMSRSLFAEQFKKKTNQTMGEFLTAQRLKKAKELLCKSDWSIDSIAEFVGYGSAKYFYTVFRHYEKCSPTKYRDSQRK